MHVGKRLNFDFIWWLHSCWLQWGYFDVYWNQQQQNQFLGIVLSYSIQISDTPSTLHFEPKFFCDFVEPHFWDMKAFLIQKFHSLSVILSFFVIWGIQLCCFNGEFYFMAVSKRNTQRHMQDLKQQLQTGFGSMNKS